MIPADCPICGDHHQVIFQYKKSGLDISVWLCRSCDFRFVFPFRSLEKNKKIYDSQGAADYTTWRYAIDFSDEAIAFQYNQLVDIQHNKPSGRLLEIGCSTGALLEVASNLGYEVSGVELSHASAVYARDRGLDVFEGTLDEAGYTPGTFGIIYSWHCFEHMPDPKCTLRTCYSILANGGIIKIGVPNAQSFSARFLGRRSGVLSFEHVSGFSIRSLSALLEQIGFEVDYIRAFGFDRYWFLVGLGLLKPPKNLQESKQGEVSLKANWRKVKWLPARMLTSVIARTLASGAGGDNLVCIAHKPS